MLKILHQVLTLAEIDPDEFSRVSGLPLATLSNTSISLTPRQRYTIYETVQQLNRHDDLAFRMAMFAAHTPLVTSTKAFAACSTVREGLIRLGEVKLPMFGITLERRDTTDTYRMNIIPTDPRGSIPLWVGLLEVLFVVEVCRTYTAKPINPIAVGLNCGDQVRSEDIAYLGVVPFSSDVSFVEFASADVELPLLSPFRANVLDARRRQIGATNLLLKQGPEQDSSVSQDIARVVTDILPSGRSSIEEVAFRLGVGVRQLQRLLEAEERSFRDILNDVRRRLAFRYLLEEGKEAAEVSFLLGYQDQNSFYRAFKTWTGMTTKLWLERESEERKQSTVN